MKGIEIKTQATVTRVFRWCVFWVSVLLPVTVSAAVHEGKGWRLEKWAEQTTVDPAAAVGSRIQNYVSAEKLANSPGSLSLDQPLFDTSEYLSLDHYLFVGGGNQTKAGNRCTGETTDPVGTATGEYYIDPVTDLDLGGPLPKEKLDEWDLKIVEIEWRRRQEAERERMRAQQEAEREEFEYYHEEMHPDSPGYLRRNAPK